MRFASPEGGSIYGFFRLNGEIKNEKRLRTIILCVKNQKKAEIHKTNFGNLIFFLNSVTR